MINKILTEIATPGSIYDEIIENILQPRLHLKPELISELAISFLGNRVKVEEVIKKGYFLYYFIRAVSNNVKSNTSPFHKNIRIKDHIYIDNIEIIDEDDIEIKMEKEEKYQRIDRAYTQIPKTYFQDFLWDQYFNKGKTYRKISKDANNTFSHCLVFVEINKIKSQMKKIIGENGKK